MTDDYQIHIPPSFVAVHADRRGRLTIPLQELRERYDLCEDLAAGLVEFAQGVHHGLGVAEDEVLARCRRGLLQAPAQVEPGEAQWVERRLAELLGWPWLGQDEADGPS